MEITGAEGLLSPPALHLHRQCPHTRPSNSLVQPVRRAGTLRAGSLLPTGLCWSGSSGAGAEPPDWWSDEFAILRLCQHLSYEILKGNALQEAEAIKTVSRG